MIVDAILILLGAAAIFTGFRNGFLQVLFTTVGYIGGGVLGLTLALHFAGNLHSDMNRIGAIVLAIFVVAELGRRIFRAFSKFFRTKILWAPLKFIDSLAGVVLEVIRVSLISYLVISVLLWSPWGSVRGAIKESSIYPRITKQIPEPIDRLRTEIKKQLSINLP